MVTLLTLCSLGDQSKKMAAANFEREGERGVGGIIETMSVEEEFDLLEEEELLTELLLASLATTRRNLTLALPVTQFLPPGLALHYCQANRLRNLPP